MPHVDHDALIAAFRRVDPGIRTCDRGDPLLGYTHIHGPHQPPGNGHCTNHTVTVEKQNGTVSLRAPIAAAMGGTARAPVPISQDPMGYSHRADYGKFGVGFTSATIQGKWNPLDDFAREVIRQAQALPVSW